MKRYTVVIAAEAPPWAMQLQTDLNRVLDAIAVDGRLAMVRKANLPGDGGSGLAFVPDEVGGPTLAFYSAGQWRRASDNAVVS